MVLVADCKLRGPRKAKRHPQGRLEGGGAGSEGRGGGNPGKVGAAHAQWPSQPRLSVHQCPRALRQRAGFGFHPRPGLDDLG